MADNQQLISLKPGTVISGRYEVVKCLGAGSMGLVYACRHKELAGKIVAVKVLFPEVAQDKTAAARFKNEIQSAYGVSHPNVVRAYEFINDSGILAYTMEYVGGGDLADKISDPDNLLPLHEVLSIAIQMGQGVQSIHDSGIVHRDLKPENILLTKEGQVKIADFGIAKTGDGPRLTEHGGVVGTIQYVSPEYMLNAQVDWRSDIYAMGVLLYEMLTGTTPFKGDSVFSTLSKSVNMDPDPPSKVRQGMPTDFDPVVLKAMNRDPDARYQSSQEMVDDLMQIAHAFNYSSKFFTSQTTRIVPKSVLNGRGEASSNLEKFEDNAVESDFQAVKTIKKTAQINRAQKKSNLLDPPDPSQTQLLDLSSKQMESVLSGQVSVYNSWDSQDSANNQRASSSKIKKPVETSGMEKSYIFTLLGALFVGITVGFAVLLFFQPQVLARIRMSLGF